MLPDRASDAYKLASDEAARNGYVAGRTSTITPLQDQATRAASTSPSTPRSGPSSCASSASLDPDHQHRQGRVHPAGADGQPAELLRRRLLRGLDREPGVNKTLTVNDPVSGKPLASQGFWGAIFTSGGLRENGDRYAPSFLGGGLAAPKGDPNPDYDPSGYDYTIEVGRERTGPAVRPDVLRDRRQRPRRLVRRRRPLDGPRPEPGHRAGRHHLPPVRHQRHASPTPTTTAIRSRRSCTTPADRRWATSAATSGRPRTPPTPNRPGLLQRPCPQPVGHSWRRACRRASTG